MDIEMTTCSFCRTLFKTSLMWEVGGKAVRTGTYTFCSQSCCDRFWEMEVHPKLPYDTRIIGDNDFVGDDDHAPDNVDRGGKQ